MNLSITGGIGGGEADSVLGDGSEGARSLGRLDGAEGPLELAAFHRISGRPIINWLQWSPDSPPQHCVRCMRRLWWVEETGVFMKEGEELEALPGGGARTTSTLTAFGLSTSTPDPELSTAIKSLRVTLNMPQT